MGKGYKTGKIVDDTIELAHVLYNMQKLQHSSAVWFVESLFLSNYYQVLEGGFS